ncbi:hypothetical protein J4467_02995 [Candidatus Woesearchaeota archaeon]|nr:hypothetical protein [Candidatus Woesearchaeota archaeon]
MSRPRTKNKVVCQNNSCSFFRKEFGKNIIKRGINKSKHKQYICLHCKKYFVETKGTPLYRRRLSERKIKELCKELVEKKGIRAVGRTTNINKNTICSYLSAFAEHAKEISKYLTKNLGLSTYEVDEFWTFVKKNKKNLSKTARRNLMQVTSGDIR